MAKAKSEKINTLSAFTWSIANLERIVADQAHRDCFLVAPKQAAIPKGAT